MIFCCPCNAFNAAHAAYYGETRNDRRGASYLAGARDIELPSLADTAARLHASPIAKLPFARDLPRLCGKVTLVDESGAEVLSFVEVDKQNEIYGSYDAMVQSRVGIILTTVAACVAPHDAVRLAERYEDSVGSVATRHSQSADLFDAFVREELEDRSPVALFLKYITQALAIPASLYIRRALAGDYPFVDLRGKWQVVLSLEGAGGGGDDAPFVLHRKWERAASALPEEQFEFEWAVKASFPSPNAGFESPPELSIRILQIVFDEHVGDAYRDGMVGLLEEWINGETVVSTGTVSPRFAF